MGRNAAVIDARFRGIIESAAGEFDLAALGVFSTACCRPVTFYFGIVLSAATTNPAYIFYKYIYVNAGFWAVLVCQGVVDILADTGTRTCATPGAAIIFAKRFISDRGGAGGENGDSEGEHEC